MSRLRLALLAAPILLASTAAQALTLDGDCKMLARGPDGKIAAVASREQVNAAISTSPLKPWFPPDGYNNASILCERDSLIPGENDYKVLQLGYALLIKTGGRYATRVGQLEVAGGAIQFRLYPGTTATPSELAQLKTVIDMLQAAYDSSPDTHKAKSN